MTLKKNIKKIVAFIMIATLMMASTVTAFASETSNTVTPKSAWYGIGSGSSFFSGSSTTIEVTVSRAVTTGQIHFTVVDPGNSASNWTWEMKAPDSSTFNEVNVVSIGNGVLAAVTTSVKSGTYVFKVSSTYASSSTAKEAYVNVMGYW